MQAQSLPCSTGLPDSTKAGRGKAEIGLPAAARLHPGDSALAFLTREPRFAAMPAAPAPADGRWGWGRGDKERAGPGAGLPGGGPGALREAAAGAGECQDSGRSVAGPPLAEARREDAVSTAPAGTGGRRWRDRRLEPALSTIPLLKFAMGPAPAPEAPGHPVLSEDEKSCL